ncbi:hypothetical protein DPMN_143654 [Dreissena polymorpha]|uniref:Uncharacterized protein n=1 Tax=Dreissena polymorpha TaxID=45954 RepID=A0A9D4JNF0_DREPO|nr:hypothetical protein DPMN_143654 [Dreissena polymorpha]
MSPAREEEADSSLEDYRRCKFRSHVEKTWISIEKLKISTHVALEQDRKNNFSMLSNIHVSISKELALDVIIPILNEDSSNSVVVPVKINMRSYIYQLGNPSLGRN